MSMKIIWEEAKKDPLKFDDIEIGGFFTFNNSLALFMKVAEFYPRAELNNEIDNDQDLYHSSDINTSYYNAVKLGSSEVCAFNSWDLVTPIDVTIQAHPKI